MTNCYASPVTCSTSGLLGPSLGEMCRASQFVFFMSFLDELIRKNERISGICERVRPVEKPDDAYDFVVVGGGAAGSIVAARLSENPKCKVLLLEAGPDEPAGSQVPSFAGSLAETRVEWNYTSSNESYACLATNGSCQLYAAKMLGGGTAHNEMIYTRGNPTDYNNWAALGNEGWTWDEVKPYFLKSEDNGEIERVGRFWHATGGPLSVERFPYLPPFGYAVIAAGDEAGYGTTEDPNGAKVSGFTNPQSTSKNGVRRSTARAFLWPVRDRTNLHVSLDSHATRIVTKNKKAVGVEYIKDGKLKQIRATEEVIVSAGAIGSPHLLLLSGIGPKEHLQSRGIQVVHNLPGVGKNLHDQVSLLVNFTINDIDTFDNDWAIAAEYLESQTGPLSGVGAGAVLATIPSSATTPEYPDIRLYFVSYDTACAPGNVGAVSSTGRRQVFLRVSYLRPKSRGRIGLASKDPLGHPVIWLNYLGNPEDVERLVEGVELALAMGETRAFRAYNLTLSPTSVEQCSHLEYPSTAYWTCAAHQGQASAAHMGGSCKMGPASDNMAVVNPRLQVYGIERLRVVDASIMPQPPSGNTAAPTVMIGERGADFIKEKWNRAG